MITGGTAQRQDGMQDLYTVWPLPLGATTRLERSMLNAISNTVSATVSESLDELDRLLLINISRDMKLKGKYGDYTDGR